MNEYEVSIKQASPGIYVATITLDCKYVTAVGGASEDEALAEAKVYVEWHREHANDEPAVIRL